MKKLIKSILTIIFFIINLNYFNLYVINRHDLVNKNYTIDNKKMDVSNKVEIMWGGISLQYFIFKHSNITTNQYIISLANGIIDTLNNDKDEYKKQINVFYMYLISNLLNLSIYGISSYKEFFAESYSRWQTTNDNMKNKSWEILNYYFSNIYNKLKNSFTGTITNTEWTNIKNEIDHDFENDESKKLIYNTNLNKKSNDLDSNKLMYKSDKFGMRDFEGYKKNDLSYGPNVLYSAYNVWNHIVGGKNIIALSDFTYSPRKFSEINLQQLANIYNLYSFDFDKLGNLNNDIYTKASQKSIESFNRLKNDEKQFNSFNDLNEYFKYKSKINDKNYSNIDIKNTLDAMKDYYKWDDSKLLILKQHVLDLFNVASKISTYKNKPYILNYLIGFIISWDYPLKGLPNGVMAYTANNITTVSNSKSTYYSYLVFTGKSLTQYKEEKDNNEYSRTWWSSPNIYATLDHEMGHVLDGYLSQNEIATINLETNYSSIVDNNYIKELYLGNIFGIDNYKTETETETNTPNNDVENIESGNSNIYIFLAGSIFILITLISFILLIYKKKKRKK
ncbi:hypothetical protein SCORR_v1c07870 [Spiroplasma corruscae]|uniref:Uncharacterized protein n=1 Tax=Spiroplasma corruscae TaxID=216934 RepID=A0A222EPU8_9MOLU|nr:hypothetical protein [Spiroplasma corruscae]ASP28559.1 hypothetical protein SCORR_v1c07870 [Spiroplasma corruscae]